MSGGNFLDLIKYAAKQLKKPFRRSLLVETTLYDGDEEQKRQYRGEATESSCVMYIDNRVKPVQSFDNSTMLYLVNQTLAEDAQLADMGDLMLFLALMDTGGGFRNQPISNKAPNAKITYGNDTYIMEVSIKYPMTPINEQPHPNIPMHKTEKLSSELVAAIKKAKEHGTFVYQFLDEDQMTGNTITITCTSKS